MTHGGSGTYDVPMPLSGPAGIECRNGSGSYTMVLTFDTPVNGGSASVTSGIGSVSGVSFSGNDMIISLTGVADQQTITVTATNVTNTGGGTLASASVNEQYLLGDTTGDGGVNSGDISQTKAQSGQDVGGGNYRNDVTVDGTINSADVSLVKSNSGH
jgi:hypothetical protein